MTTSTITRRDFLRATGVALALPMLEAMRLPASAAAGPSARRRMVAIMTPLGIHAENLFPAETGRGYTAPLYLQALEPLRNEFTVFSGL